MSFEVRIENYDNLTEQEREEVPNNGSGKEYAQYLRITWDGETVGLFSTAMEPEDVTFTRDLAWVGIMIKKAYAIGLGDASINAMGLVKRLEVVAEKIAGQTRGQMMGQKGQPADKTELYLVTVWQEDCDDEYKPFLCRESAVACFNEQLKKFTDLYPMDRPYIQNFEDSVFASAWRVKLQKITIED